MFGKNIYLRLLLLVYLVCRVHAVLHGIGYREQELQQAKGSRFSGEDPTGIKWASYAGGTNIFIKGSHFATASQNNIVMLYSHELEQTIVAPLLTEDDAFGSNPEQGFIIYRLPSLGDLMGVPLAFLDSYSTMTFDLSIQVNDGLQEAYTDTCSTASLCKIIFKQSHTPVINHFNPPVVYLDSMTEVVFDPKTTTSLIQDLNSDEMPFINVRIGGNQIDFEYNVDYETSFRKWSLNNALGQVGEMIPSQDNNVTMLWETGFANTYDAKIMTCSYDNQTCYKVKSVPAIYDINANTGYITGGQNLTITGTGFNAGTAVVEVDGVGCTVTEQTKNSLSCTIQSTVNASVVSNDTAYVGQHGIRRTLVNSTESSSNVKISTVNDTSIMDFVKNESIALTLATPKDEGTNIGNVFKGWFVPPASANYKFYMSCDDHCILKLGQTPGLGDNVTDVQDIIEVYQWSEWRDYWKVDDTNRSSSWMALEADKAYFLEAQHVEFGGGDHLTVAVEIERNDSTGHYHSLKEQQYIGFMPETYNQDTVRITIENPDDGNYLLSFVNPTTLGMTMSSQYAANADVGTVREAVKSFYSESYGSDITVELTMYDADNITTTNQTNSVRNVYDIKMQKLVESESTSKIYVAKTTTKSTISVQYPSEVQLSTAPITGNFQVKCIDENGFESNSQSISWNDGLATIKSRIETGCAKLYDKITVSHGNMTTLPYYENGRNISITFDGLSVDPGQFSIITDTETPLSGNVTYFQDTSIPSGGNLWYDPIPFEMLKTYETLPQVLVTIGDLPAVCHNVTCNYTYVDAVGEISSFTFDATAGTLNIVGVDLPTNITNLTSITFAHSTCSIDTTTYTETNIDCTLDRTPVCGDFSPVVLSYMGIIPNNAAVVDQTVTCTITGVNPTTSMNLIGADNVTITGTNFPYELQTSTVEVSFGNTAATTCQPKTSTSTELVCLTDKFDTTADASATGVGMTVIINGQTVPTSSVFDMKSSVSTSTSISPNSVSPVLKTDITVQLDSNFPFTLAATDFTINATDQNNATNIRYLRPVSVDDTSKTFVAKFGGAWSGVYDVSIRHAEYGLLETSSLILNVTSEVASISRNTASIYGGTLLTIVGTNYGTTYTDNPVQVSYNGALGSTHCFVQTTEATQITCRIDDSQTIDDGKVGEVVVFLKVSEESNCTDDKCQMTFTSALPTLTSAAVEFDNTNNQWVLAVIGENFTGDATTTEFKVNGVDQVIKSWSASRVEVTLTNLTSQSLALSKMYFDIGIPANHSIVSNTTLTLEPKLVSLSILEGSVGGTNITANVQGVGTATTGLELVDSVSGASLCSKLTILSYGVVQCQTIAGEIASGTQFAVKLDSVQYECVNTDLTQCQYFQSPTATFPKITVVDISSGDMVLTGTDFFTSDYDAFVSFASVNADVVTVDSGTQITAQWTKGLPPTINDTASIYFSSQTTTDLTHYAENTQAVQNPIVLSSSSNGITTSFAGGQVYQVQAAGLASLMRDFPNSYNISVCENVCAFSEADSSNSAAACILPPISTSYSNVNFNITKESVLDSGKYFGSSSTADHSVVFDKNNLNTLDDSSSDCHVGMEFRDGYVGSLSKVKYMVSDIAKENFIDVLSFEGSDDGSTYTNLFTADYNVGSGWNTHDFDTTSPPKYKYYRFKGTAANSCKLNEIQLYGVETIDNSDTTYNCVPKLHADGTTTDLNAVTYDGALTPLLESIVPRYGNVVGGEDITFTGSGFGTTVADVSIVIDEVVCTVSSVTDTQIVCATGARTGLHNATLDMTIAGKGSVSKQGLLFTYANYWSADDTWGGEYAPMDGESIHIPAGLNLLVDIDVSPEINALIVEGSLIFAPHPTDKTHHRKFDAHYIFVSGGKMEVGTADFPYDSLITITMHGTISDPYLPLYGNKCIGLREATLDMHGAARQPTWTVLFETAEAGSTTIKLNAPVDWVAGDVIAIASTSYDSREAEQRTITAIVDASSATPVVTLDKPLVYKHFAATETYGSQQIDMRAEVGLLTRSVVYKGDDEHTVDNQYGAIIFIHSEGDDSLRARFSNTEFTQVGQAFKVGRYPVHFHLIGSVHESYAQGNAVHTSFNRAFTIHGNEYLRITDNVAFNCMGHTIFIEDGIERYNYIARNLIIMTKRSWSLLNTDQTPACFWITNPNNDFIDNHAAGSDRYGYWYDLQTHAIGPSADTSVCPEHERVGEFRNNHAHSMGRYGLRIFHNMVPRTYPCRPVQYDASNTADPFWQNPIFEANFYNLTSWKNNRNGAIAERVGWVVFRDFKVADNLLAGIEFSLTDEVGEGRAAIKDALIVGKTSNTEGRLDWASPKGIIGPRTENFNIDGVEFYNYDFNDAAALSTCSHCFHSAATDSGARTIKTQRLVFDATVAKKIRYQYPQRAIFHDLDGTLTGKGANSMATKYYPYLLQPECEYDATVYDSVLCDPSVQIRRVAFGGYAPGHLDGQGMKILNWDDSITSAQSNLTTYRNSATHTDMFWKKKSDPTGWALPWVTGHKYKVSWGGTGIDFEQMTLTLSERWETTDKNIVFVHNFTDVRQAYEVTAGGASLTNASLASPTSISSTAMEPGQWYFNNDTEYLYVGVNGKSSADLYSEYNIKLVGVRCLESCFEIVLDNLNDTNTTEATERLWSDPASWPTGAVPVEGEDVHIEPGWNMTMDLEETPILGYVEINGLLVFQNHFNHNFRAKIITIRAGELQIGTAEEPYTAQANITLHGAKEDEAKAFDNDIAAINKFLANINKLSIYGQPRTKTLTRLHAPAKKGDSEAWIETGLDLVAGDRLAFAATSFDALASDEAIVASYDNNTGLVTLNSTLDHYHWGAADSTASQYGNDIRGEVLVLSRNVKIIGEDIESWGGQVITSDTLDVNTATGEISFRSGQTILQNVEIYNASQHDTPRAALRFESAIGAHSSVVNCSVHNGLGWSASIYKSANINLDGNIFWVSKPVGLRVDTGTNITIKNNFVGHVTERETDGAGGFIDKWGAYVICSLEGTACRDVYVTDNIAAGSPYAGFVAPSYACGDENTQQFFRNNVAHSIDGKTAKGGAGIITYANPAYSSHASCLETSNNLAYKCTNNGFYAIASTDHLVVKHMTVMDNGQGGFGARAATGDYTNGLIEVTENKIMGESAIPDCPDSSNGDYCIKIAKVAVVPGGFGGSKSLHPQKPSKLPYWKSEAHNWAGLTHFTKNKISDFGGNTMYGMRSVVLGSVPWDSDITQPNYFYDNEFIDVAEDSFAQLASPQAGWANIKDCGNFPCTAPNNVLNSFHRTVWSGRTPYNAKSRFQLIGNNPGFSPYQPDCEFKSSWNAYLCEQPKLSQLLFESNDFDKMDRAMQPIIFQQEGTEEANTMNAYMDHVWDGFYTGQVRLSRFPVIVHATRGTVYDVTFTGTPAQHMTWKLVAEEQSAGAMIRIAYPSALSRAILINGKIIEYNQWDKQLNQYGEITFSFCGENRYIGVKNIFEFYITAGCTLEIKPRDAIQSMVRMEWTMKAFMASGGTTAFVDRVAGTLGIHASQIKVVSVYEGSLVINYNIVAAEGESDDSLKAIAANQLDKFATGDMDLGAPILDVITEEESIVSDGTVSAAGYDPIVITKTASAAIKARSPGVFKPNLPTYLEEASVTQNVTVQRVIDEKVIEEKVYIKKADDGQTSWIIICSSIILLGVLVAGLMVRWFFIQQKKDLIAAEMRKKGKADLEHEIEMDAQNKHFEELPQETCVTQTGAKLNVEQYEQQYDPNNDFAIFNVGNKAVGGLMTMKEKMNAADTINKNEDETSDEEEVKQDSNQSPVETQSPLQSTTSLPQIGNKNGANAPLTLDNLDALGLPEDQEIQEQDEEEEEDV